MLIIIYRRDSKHNLSILYKNILLSLEWKESYEATWNVLQMVWLHKSSFPFYKKITNNFISPKMASLIRFANIFNLSTIQKYISSSHNLFFQTYVANSLSPFYGLNDVCTDLFNMQLLPNDI